MKCIRVSRILVAILFTGTTGVMCQTSTGQGNGPPPKYDPISVERGKTTFVGACGFCHGSSAKGGEKGPDLLRSVLVLDDENGNAIGPVILRGRPDKGMPRLPFTPQQIADIALSFTTPSRTPSNGTTTRSSTSSRVTQGPARPTSTVQVTAHPATRLLVT